MEIKRYQLLSEPERHLAGNLVRVMSISTHEVDTSILDVQTEDVEGALLIAMDMIGDLRASKQKLDGETTALGQELQSARANLRLAKDEVQLVTQRCRDSEAHCMALEEELARQKSLNEELHAKLKMKDEEVVSLDQHLRKYAAAYKEQKQLLDSKSLEIQELQRKVEAGSSLNGEMDPVQGLEDLYQRIVSYSAYNEVRASTAAKHISIGIQTLGQNPIGRRIDWVRENSSSHLSVDAFRRKSVQPSTTLNRMDINNPKR